MIPPRKALLTVLLAAVAAVAAGCSSSGPKKSSIPWSQPQSWEGQIPGMGQPSGR
jgi:hypothetical protein